MTVHKIRATCPRCRRRHVKELDLTIKEDAFIEKVRFERALAQRAMIIKSDLTTLAHSGAIEICSMVGGDDSRIPDLIEHLLDKFENLLGRYSAPASL